jgi:SAM-dependent methyltransferase
VPDQHLGVIYPANYYAFASGGNQLVERLRRVWEGGKVRLYRELVGEGPRRILDVGCGNGRFLGLLRDFGCPEWRLVGIDLDADAAAECRARGFEAHVGRVEDFDVAGPRFDAVIMLQLIEHVEDPAAICRHRHAAGPRARRLPLPRRSPLAPERPHRLHPRLVRQARPCCAAARDRPGRTERGYLRWRAQP